MYINLKNWQSLKEKKKITLLSKNVSRVTKNIVKNNYSYLPFINNKHNKKLYRNIEAGKKFFSSKKKIYLIGTGGSSLGSKSVLDFMLKKRVVIIENIDPNTLTNVFLSLDMDRTGFLIISKSGETIETLSIFNMIINKFKKKSNLKKNCLIITEKKNSTLTSIANLYCIKQIEHDPSIGGRYSCFSVTGLLPLSIAGLNSQKIKLLANKEFKDILIKNKHYFNQNIACLLKFTQENTKYIGHVVISYLDGIKSAILWYRQLWSESLGKGKNNIHFMHAYGSEDQHSQLQMWLDGPNNLIYTIIMLKKRKSDYLIKDKKSVFPSFMKNKFLGEIFNTMAEATATELIKAKRPVRIIYLDNDNLEAIIKFKSYMMLEVAILGKLCKINPFNQPKVEKVKIRTKEFLNKDDQNY